MVLDTGPQAAADDDVLRRIAADLAAPGARIIAGWVSEPDVARAPPQVLQFGTVRFGTVRSGVEAGAAVLAAVAGARLVVWSTADRDVTDALCDDLRRLGDLDHRVGAAEPLALSADQRSLLSHLLAGRTLGEAAAALHLSRRTADRRLAAARRGLGVKTTAEALAAAVRQGVRPPAPSDDDRTPADNNDTIPR